MVGGQARLSATAAATTAIPTVFPTQKPTALAQYFEQRSVQDDRRFKHEVEFQKLLVGREQLENKRLELNTKQQKINLLEKKLERLEKQNKTNTEYYDQLQTRVDELYKEL